MAGIILRNLGGEAVFIDRQGFVALLRALSLAGLMRGATMARLESGQEVVLNARDVARMKGFLAQVVRPNLAPGQRLRSDMTIAHDGDGLHSEVLLTLVRFLRRARGPVTVAGQQGGEEASSPASRPTPDASAAPPAPTRPRGAGALVWHRDAGYA